MTQPPSRRIVTYDQLTAALDSASTTVPPHTHDAADIVTGVLTPAHLGTGTASASTFLAGDGTWKTPAQSRESFPFFANGVLAVGVGTAELPLPDNYTLDSITARLNVPSTSGSVILDVKYNGTTIFGTSANRPTFAQGSKTALVGTASVASFTSGGYITVDIAQVGTSAAGLVLLLRLLKA